MKIICLNTRDDDNGLNCQGSQKSNYTGFKMVLGSMLDLSYAPYIDTSLNIDINSQIPIKQNIGKLSVRYKNGVVLN